MARGALFDELEKISQAQPGNKEKFKKWLKNAAIITAGTGAGTAAFMLTNQIIGPTISPKMRALLVGAAALGASVASNKMMELKSK